MIIVNIVYIFAIFFNYYFFQQPKDNVFLRTLQNFLRFFEHRKIQEIKVETKPGY